jgi:hypothetical protein
MKVAVTSLNEQCRKEDMRGKLKMKVLEKKEYLSFTSIDISQTMIIICLKIIHVQDNYKICTNKLSSSWG